MNQINAKHLRANFIDAQKTWDDNATFCLDAGANAATVLELGCQTGQISVALSARAHVVGVDHEEAMLEHARARPGGHRATWVNADLRRLRLGEKFDLVMMGNYVFHHMLTHSDQAAALRTIKAHLAPNGRFIINVRNITADRYRKWCQSLPVQSVLDDEFGKIEQSMETQLDEVSQIATYIRRYRAVRTGMEFHDRTMVTFFSKAQLDQMLQAAELSTSPCYGDWMRSDFNELSPEIIFHGSHL